MDFFLFVVDVEGAVEDSAALCGSKLGDSPAAGFLFFLPIAHWWWFMEGEGNRLL